MSYQNISAEISDEIVGQQVQRVKEIEQDLPFIINLTIEERKTLPLMGDKSIPFVEKSIEFARQQPDLVTSFLDVDELAKDLVLARRLKKILNVIEPLYEKVQDTYLAVGSEAFAAARTFYRTVKNAARSGVPGVDAIASELSKRYERRANMSKKEKEEEKEK
jgi:hypothetical protein